MCGVAGIVGSGAGTDLQQRVSSMLRSLARRGPDDEGIEAWPDAVLGHRRLAVFDVSAAGHQPMLSQDGSVGLVFNGAIYNFKSLRSELEQSGFQFTSNSDTEVLLHGYRAWGIVALARRIEGMFAFGLWDNNEKKLFLVRDRLGVKPLVIARSGSVLAFASTVRALKTADFGGEINSAGMLEYLEFGFLTDDTAIYSDIEKLPPATVLEFSNSRISTTKYWTLDTRTNDRISFNEAVEETERLFVEAVRKRLQADVKVGALLSGGIDSSLVCWAVAQLGGDVAAFTVGVPGDDWDESAIARQTASQIGIEHRVLEMSGETHLDTSSLTEAYAEPFACASALGLLEVSAEVARHATVLLTGDGGDDVFLGYPEHAHFHLAQRIAGSTPKMLGAAIRELSDALPKPGVLKRANSFLSYCYGGLGGIIRARDGLPVYERDGLLGERLSGQSFPHRDIPLTSGRNVLADFLHYDRRTRFVGEYLPKVDGGTMHHALEARSPFLDATLWEFAATLPFAVRLKGGTLKAVLREIVRRRIGSELAAGKKQGFGVPVQRWLCGRWEEQFRESMSDSILDQEGWINSAAVLRLFDKERGSGWVPRQLWFVLVLENWLRAERGRSVGS